MSIATPAALPATVPAAVPEEPIHRLTVEQYHQMLDAGILISGDPVELLEGWLVEKMTKHPPHRVATRLTRGALERILPAGWYVDSQEPVTTLESEPEPDVSIIRGQTRDYLKRHPKPKEVGLLVEVADDSLSRDRGLKKRIYARAKIPYYWIINLIDNQIEAYSKPTGPAAKPDYRQRQVYRPGEELPVILDGKEIGRIPVKDILP